MPNAIYTEDGKVLIEKKSDSDGVTVTTENLADITSDVESRQKKKTKDKKDAFDREPMRLCATGTTVGCVGVGSYFAFSGLNLFICAAIGMLGFYFTMLAKGSRHSTYCIVLAVINIVFAATTLVIKLKSLGVLDWLKFSM